MLFAKPGFLEDDLTRPRPRRASGRAPARSRATALVNLSGVSEQSRLIEVRRLGEGPPLLLVHGLGGSSANWDPVLELLERRSAS